MLARPDNQRKREYERALRIERVLFAIDLRGASGVFDHLDAVCGFHACDPAAWMQVREVLREHGMADADIADLVQHTRVCACWCCIKALRHEIVDRVIEQANRQFATRGEAA
jgi:hypothetical protein